VFLGACRKENMEEKKGIGWVAATREKGLLLEKGMEEGGLYRWVI